MNSAFNVHSKQMSNSCLQYTRNGFKITKGVNVKLIYFDLFFSFLEMVFNAVTCKHIENLKDCRIAFRKKLKMYFDWQQSELHLG